MSYLNVVEEIYSRNYLRTAIPFRRTRQPLSLSRKLESVKATGHTGIIAEFKRKSPSGFSNSEFTGVEDYFNSLMDDRKVAAFSVLTEPSHFSGDYCDVTNVQKYNTPILDKDFISSKEMVDYAFNSGADAILLILDFLEAGQLYLLSEYAVHLGMESLIEFHDLELAKEIRPGKGRLFGYNRRNLKTLKMEPQEERLGEFILEKKIPLVLESGITTEYVKTHDVSVYSGLLVGTSILKGDRVHDYC